MALKIKILTLRQKMAAALIILAAFLFCTLPVYAIGVPTPSADPITEANCKSPNTASEVQKCVSNNQIIKDLQKIVDVLSAGVAIIIVVMIIVGGIQYAAAGDSPEAVTKAKKRITNALIALAAFIFLDAFVQWLIPGGIFG